jgi:hypothetical protein
MAFISTLMDDKNFVIEDTINNEEIENNRC